MGRRITDRFSRRGRVPAAWPSTPAEGRRPRVLIEAPSHATPAIAAQLLERAGYETLVCDGPGDRTGICRLLEDGACPLVEGADLVYNAFGLGTSEHREIVAAVRRARPEVPIVIETTRPSAEQHDAVLDGCVVCPMPVSSSTMVATVSSALDRTRQPTG